MRRGGLAHVPAALLAASLACGALGTARRAWAQDALGWSGSAEASANFLYGAARSRVASLGAGVSRADSALEVRTDAAFTYADALDADDRRTVTARSARATLAVDRTPFARVSPFAFGSVEGSHQQRIALRASGGAGAKYTFHRRDENEASVSLALLGERTRALRVDSVQPATTTRVRWSLRGRLRHQVSESVRLSHVTFYQPAVDRFDRYTVDSNTQLAVNVARALALTTTWRERYDSEARRRGARSNHDGQILFGVRATF